MKKCSNCGAKMVADTSQVFTSYPPQYKYRCPKCGNTEYGLCSENESFEETETNESVKDFTNWDNMRNLAAMHAMNALIIYGGGLFNKEEIASMAVTQADELINQLKKQ
jgi:ribosomal protein S27AE